MWLTVRSSNGVVIATHQLGEGRVVTVGRDPGNDLVVDDDAVAPHHLRLSALTGSSVTVDDLGSGAGTSLDGSALTRPTVVLAGRALRIGRHTIGLTLHAPAAPEPSSSGFASSSGAEESGFPHWVGAAPSTLLSAESGGWDHGSRRFDAPRASPSEPSAYSPPAGEPPRQGAPPAGERGYGAPPAGAPPAFAPPGSGLVSPFAAPARPRRRYTVLLVGLALLVVLLVLIWLLVT